MRKGPDGSVLEPASGAFDVILAPSDDLQAGINKCPVGGSVLLQPGLYEGKLRLRREVHVFGRGHAALTTHVGDTVVMSKAPRATLDGVGIRQAGGEGGEGGIKSGVWVKRGRMRLQNCDVSSSSGSCILVSDGADPVIAHCRCVRGRGGGAAHVPTFIKPIYITQNHFEPVSCYT